MVERHELSLGTIRHKQRGRHLVLAVAQNLVAVSTVRPLALLKSKCQYRPRDAWTQDLDVNFTKCSGQLTLSVLSGDITRVQSGLSCTSLVTESLQSGAKRDELLAHCAQILMLPRAILAYEPFK